MLVDKILDIEWDMLSNAQKTGFGVPYWDDKTAFYILRGAQTKIWSLDFLENYLADLENAVRAGENLMSVKYARMMRTSYSKEYGQLRDTLPAVSPKVTSLCGSIMRHHSRWSKEAASKYPKLFLLGRSQHCPDSGNWASMDNHLRCELLTYSEKTLEYCLRDTENAFSEGINLSLEILRITSMSYGYGSLEQLEKVLNS